MRNKYKYLGLHSLFLMFPLSVEASSNTSTHSNFPSLINLDAVFQYGAVVNDVTNSNNFSLIIIGLVVVIIVLIGAVMFTKKWCSFLLV